jgi:RimJ/RimL family protein N-acetyltransferase
MVRIPERVHAGTVVLRRHRLEDAPALVEAIDASFEHLHPWMPWAAERPTMEGITAFLTGSIANFDAGAEFGFALLDPTESHVVGSIGLHARRGPDTREIGYWVHVDWTRRGIASSAARALAHVALGIPGVHRVEIHCDVDNVASAGVPRSLGWELSAIVPRPPDAPGESGREMVWTLDRDAADREQSAASGQRT